jgi:hypothetical protein
MKSKKAQSRIQFHRLDPPAIIEFDLSSAKKEITTAWKQYQTTEKYGLEFGRVIYEWRKKFKTKSGRGNKGKGMVPMLESLSIPISTAYWWNEKYQISIGEKDERNMLVQSDDLDELDELDATTLRRNVVRAERQIQKWETALEQVPSGEPATEPAAESEVAESGGTLSKADQERQAMTPDELFSRLHAFTMHLYSMVPSKERQALIHTHVDRLKKQF